MKKIFSLFLFLMGIFSLSIAQESPNISLTLIFMPERHVCPGGYTDYVKGEISGCAAVAINQVDRWKRKYSFIETEAPPSQYSNISLGETLFGLIDLYRTAPRNTPDERKSIVVIFDWKSAQTTDVRLTRKMINTSGQLPFPEMTWEGRLQKESRWIHHERADAYLPIHGVTWIFESGDQRWEFGTDR